MLKFQKHKIRQTGNDQNILINLSSRNNHTGLTDGLSNFIEEKTGLSINPAKDKEVIRFQSISNIAYYFNFYNTGTTSYGLTLENAGFTVNDFNRNNIIKSYYILQVYDSIKSESQKLLYTGFLGLYNYPTGFSTIYNLPIDREFNNIFLNVDDLDNLTSDSVYIKLSFFNAKKGKQQLFFNVSKISDTTENIFYFDCTINKTNRTFDVGVTLNAREFINYNYVSKINENLNILLEEKVIYPTGGTALSGNTYFVP